jgi:ABC-type phosphate transport system ATPase subunit
MYRLSEVLLMEELNDAEERLETVMQELIDQRERLEIRRAIGLDRSVLLLRAPRSMLSNMQEGNVLLVPRLPSEDQDHCGPSEAPR